MMISNLFCVKVPFILIMSFLFLTVSFGQGNYSKATVEYKNGKTSEGLIDFKNWDKNPDKIKFLDPITNQKSDFTPSEIKSFSVEGLDYVSAKVKEEISSLNTDELEYSAELKLKDTDVFLRKVISGDKQLYLLKNSNSKSNFYIQNDETYELLEYKKYLKKLNGNDKIRENLNFKPQLANYLNDCKSISGMVGSTSYSLKSLQELFKSYSECTDRAIIPESHVGPKSFEWGVLLGVSRTAISFNSPDAFGYLVDADYMTSINPAGGVYANIAFPGNLKRFWFRSELLYTSYKVDGLLETVESEEVFSTDFIELAYSYMKLNLLLRYNFQFNNSQLFINGGVSNGVVISETNYWRKDETIFTTERTRENLALQSITKYEQSYIAGLGFSHRQYSVELRLENGNGISDFVGLSSPTTRQYLLLGYQF